MAVGIVVVSHSAALAEAAAELARAVAGADLRLALAGGVDDPEHPLGTDAVRVLAAIEEVADDDGVLVLMDLGSAVLSAEMAVELLPEATAGTVLLCEAPLIEGLVAAAVQAAAGADLAQVASEARAGLAGKAAHLGVPEQLGPTTQPATTTAPGDGVATAADVEARLVVTNALGLHARPAARIVETVARFAATVALEATRPSGSDGDRPAPVPASSLAGIITLGVRGGDELVVRASGTEADAAVAALRELAADNFGDPVADVADVAAASAPDTPRAAPVPERPGTRSGTERDTLRGLPAAPGLAVAAVHRLDGDVLPDTPVRQVADVPAEQARLRDAIDQAAAGLRTSRELLTTRAGGEARDMLTTQLLLLEDPLLVDPALAEVADEQVDAATAWRRSIEAMVRTYRAIEDAYLAERASDVQAVGAEVLRQLLGDDRPSEAPSGVVVAADMGPADTARLEPQRVAAIVTAGGSPTSHASLIARALGIPAVVGVGDLAALTDGATVLVDGDRGTVRVAPDATTLAEAERTITRQRVDGEAARREATEPARTRDGTHVEVAANIGLPGDTERAVTAGADGVGLLRSEFLFLDRADAPAEDEQVAVYEQACRVLDGRPVVLRTLDVGGDKPLPYLDLPEEVNPFLGTRGLRLGLDRPALLTTQLRAALRVAARHPLRVMLPMVSTVTEVTQARALLEAARAQLVAEGVAAADDLQLGAMVEVPALALQAEALVGAVDFVSIGTNDLTQYVMAAERGNGGVAHLADPLQPAVLRLVRAVCDAASAAQVPVAVCGDVAADAAAVPLLLGLGVRELSVPPPAVPTIKRAVRRCDLSGAADLAAAALAAGTATDVRALLADADPGVGRAPDG